LLHRVTIPLIIVDYDRVEEHNLYRQNFYAEDLGKFKSQVLAERYSRRYKRPIGYSVQPFEHDMREKDDGSFSTPLIQNCLIIGCVDGYEGRRSIAEVDARYPDIWWIDAGNGDNSGQVLIGNTYDLNNLKRGFLPDDNIVTKLPAPSLQMPALLMPNVSALPVRDCAEAIEHDEQSPVINQAMAMLVVETIRKLAMNELTYMAAYIDLDTGNMSYIQAEPANVARITGMKQDKLLFFPEQKTNIFPRL
jgi:hypothetical protein